MSEKTIFSKIIDQEIPGHFIYEDDVCVVIMDAFPSVAGQVLVIPRTPTNYIFDLNDTTYNHLWQVTKRVSQALDVAFDTSRTCVIVEGFEVPHVHIKLYPLPADAKALTDYITHTEPADQAVIINQCEQIKAALNS